MALSVSQEVIKRTKSEEFSIYRAGAVRTMYDSGEYLIDLKRLDSEGLADLLCAAEAPFGGSVITTCAATSSCPSVE